MGRVYRFLTVAGGLEFEEFGVAGAVFQELVVGALFFHAARVSPGWGGLTRLARVDNHVFYR